MINIVKSAFISSFLPRECGIATYTNDISSNIEYITGNNPRSIVAMNDLQSHYKYGKRVVLEIDQNNRNQYKQTANRLNSSDFDLVNLQHEFGLFGQEWGKNILELLKYLKLPTVTTLHTIIPKDSGIFKNNKSRKTHEMVLSSIGEVSDALIVLTKMGKDILTQDYNIDPNKIHYIPHGVPTLPFVKSRTMKKVVGLEGRKVLSTFGFLRSGKGLEYTIAALPSLIKDWPEIIYLIIGETHPSTRRKEGEKYLNFLKKLVKKYNLENHVRFYNKYHSNNEIFKLLLATDVYVSPYLGKNQISSGTIAYALAAGRVVVSTPIDYSVEVLANDRGVLCEFGSYKSISDHIASIFQNPKGKSEIERAAHTYSVKRRWPYIAKQYLNLFENVIEENQLLDLHLPSKMRFSEILNSPIP